MRMTCESCGSVSRHIDSDDALAGAIADIAWAKRAEDAAVDAARGREGGSDSGNLEPEQGTCAAGVAVFFFLGGGQVMLCDCVLCVVV